VLRRDPRVLRVVQQAELDAAVDEPAVDRCCVAARLELYRI
jgi:hypothetical protein